MNKLRIGVDLDGVLVNLLEVWLDRYNVDFNDHLSSEDITSWDIRKFIKPKARNIMFDYLNDPTLYDNAGVISHQAKSILQKWKEEKHEIFIITSCGNRPNMIKAKLEWLEERYPFLDKRNFVFVDNKSVAKVDIMIDDHASNLKAMMKTNPDMYPFLFQAPHNKGLAEKHGFLNASNWQSVDNMVSLLSYELGQGRL